MKVWAATSAAVVAVVAVFAELACLPATTAANCYGISFKIAEKLSISDINQFEKFYSIIFIIFF